MIEREHLEYHIRVVHVKHEDFGGMEVLIFGVLVLVFGVFGDELYGFGGEGVWILWVFGVLTV